MCILCDNYVDLFECTLDFYNKSFVSKLFIDGMCVVALAPATKTMSGTMFHPLAMMLLMSG